MNFDDTPAEVAAAYTRWEIIRFLGLPAEPRIDKQVPFDELGARG